MSMSHRERGVLGTYVTSALTYVTGYLKRLWSAQLSPRGSQSGIWRPYPAEEAEGC